MPDLVCHRTIDFLIWEWLGLERLMDVPRYAAHDRAAIDAVLEVAHRFAAEQLAPDSRRMDTEEPSIDKAGNVRVHPSSAAAVRGLATGGFFATVFDEAQGGLQLPLLVHATLLGLHMAGCVGTASYILLTVGNARLIVEKGTPPQIAAFAEPQIAGTTMGTMCLSEPHAGSSLGDITTRAIADGEDRLGRRFRIHGSKMWISGGDQDITANIVHLVLAKVTDADGGTIAGTRGISLFIVPKMLADETPNDISIAGLNHKLGQRVLPNCAMTFGEGRHRPEGRDGAIGWLLGDIGQGLAQMFQMMNDARISVGMGGAVLALRGYRLSLAYAKERVQGNLSRGGPSVAIIEHADVKRMLLAQKSIAEGAFALVLYAARLLDQEQTAPDATTRVDAARLLRLLTPAVKSWPAEMGQESLHLAIQVLGGAGYTRDFEVEKLYRDNRLNPIHEGTTGIQAIDLVERKLRRDGGSDFALLADRIDATVERGLADPRLAAPAATIRAASDRLRRAVAILVGADQAQALANATPFLHAFGQVAVAWLWLDQAIVASRSLEAATGTDIDFYTGKLQACRYFAHAELPRIAQWLAPVETLSDIAATTSITQF